MDLHGLLLADKPRGLTSHDVVAQVRRRLGTRRVGHAGTLDPAAEGLLIVAVGAAAKVVSQLQDADKQYIAHVVLGVSSDSHDVEGLAQTISDGSCVPERADIEQTLRAFVGAQLQVPPAHSAIKVGGQALYHRARRGEAIDVPARRVAIHVCELIDYSFPDLLMRVDCGKGVYIRSIARDLGDRLGTGAYLHALLRTRSAGFSLADAWTLHEMEQCLQPETWPMFGLHPDVALLNQPALVIDSDGISAWYHGRSMSADASGRELADQEARVYDGNGEWLGRAVADREGRRWQPRQVVGMAPGHQGGARK